MIVRRPLRFGRLPPELGYFSPTALVATVGGIGLLPLAPGTWGSLAALPLAWLVWTWGGPAALLVAALVAAGLGWWAAERYARHAGLGDPQTIVIDEVAGQLLTLCVVPLDPWSIAAGFLAFRAMDIAKPWPISWADRSLRGGLGIMLDDLLAALYAAVLLYGMAWVAGGSDVFG